MATIQNSLACAALALAMWSCCGFAIGRQLLPRSLALPFAPLLGWASQSAIALLLFFLIGMTRTTVVTTTLLSVIVALFSLLRYPGGSDAAEADPVRVPPLAIVGGCLLACAITMAIIPTVTPGGAAVAGPIFDHTKIAIVDDMARLGVPAGNPFFEENGGITRLSYYYLWHFSAAELSILTGYSGWEADAGMTCFTAVSSLTLMMGLAVWLSSRAAPAFWVLAVSATSSIREIPNWIFGWQIIGAVSGWPTGFGGWLFQSAWAPQHVASAGCTVIAVFFLVQLARRQSWASALTMSLVSASAFESSTWVGGITYPLAVVVIGAILLIRIEPKRRWRFVGLTVAAAILAIAVSSTFIHDQFRAAMARGDGSPISFLPYEVLDDPIPEAVRALLDLPAYWTVFLFVEFAAFYPAGFFFAVRLSKEKLAPEMRTAAISLGVLAAVSLGVGSVMVSTMAANNDLAWRGVLPGILALIALTAAGLGRYLHVMRTRYAVATMAIIVLGLMSGARNLYPYLNVRPQASAKRFLDSVQMWAAVQKHSAAGERVANNPDFLADITPWPINISWALLANRRSCYAGPDFALPFAPVTRDRRAEIEAEFTRLFSGKLSRSDVDQMAADFDCSLVVVTPEDGAWTTGPLASDSPYNLVESKPDAWRIYRIQTKSVKH
jgi:hypothetical protein